MDGISYHCPACSADLKFNPTTGTFVCTYCDSIFTRYDLEAQGKSGVTPVSSPQDDAATKVMAYHCANCGAQVITDDTTVATECYYCHSAVILKGRLDASDLPKRIVPFRFDKTQAQETFRKWAHRKNFIPKEFGNEEDIQGIYFPYWLVDVDGEVQYNGDYYRIETHKSLTGRRRYRVEYAIAKKGQIHMEDIALSALKKSRKELLEGIQPFHEDGMEPFSMTYLAGFQAEEKDMAIDEINTPEIKGMISAYAEAKVNTTFPRYGRHVKKAFHFTQHNASWEYSLMPVWLLSRCYKGEYYYFAMNAQTGKVCGKLPVDETALRRYTKRVGLLIGLVLFVLTFVLLGGM